MRSRRKLNEQQRKTALDISVESLKGKQSVRATFRLPNELIELLGLVANQFGLKQKSLFDQLVEDGESLVHIAESTADSRRRKGERRPKTFVISKKTLDLLEKIARERQVPRDVLVEASIKRLLPLLTLEQEKHEKRLELYNEGEKFMRQGRQLTENAKKFLGENDQVTEAITEMVRSCEETMSKLAELVEKGKSVAGFRPKSLFDDGTF